MRLRLIDFGPFLYQMRKVALKKAFMVNFMEFHPIELKINDRMSLSYFHTNKFKTSVLKITLISKAPLCKNDTATFSLMVNMLKSGTVNYPDKADIIKRLNDLYDSSCSMGGYALGDNRIFEISAEMLSDKFSNDGSITLRVAELMKELILYPNLDVSGNFRSSVVDREKKSICDRLKSEKNNSRDYALRRCREIMCENEPYGQMVEPKVLMDIKIEELLQFYRNFIDKSQIHFSYVGDLSQAEIKKIISDVFSSEDICNHSEELNPLKLYPENKYRQISENMNIKQSVLAMGFRTNTLSFDDDAHVLRVFNNVFGGLCTSRLFKIIREKLSLCYYCSSDFISTKGLMYVSCGIESENFDVVKNEILNQLDILKNEEIDEKELCVAKDFAIKDLKEILDYPGAMATFRYSRFIYNVDETIDDLANKISKVSVGDIKAMANKIRLDTVFFLNGTVSQGDGFSEDDYE